MKKAYAMIAIAFIFGAFLTAQTGPDEKFAQEYEKINKNYAEKSKAAKNREEQKKLAQERTAQLETLLNNCQNEKSDEGLVLLQGRILLDLNRSDDAIKKFDALLGNMKSATLQLQTKLYKVKALVQNENAVEALPLFREIESQFQPGPDLLQIWIGMIYGISDNQVKEEYAKKFLAVANLPEEMQDYVAMVYQALGEIAAGEKNLPKAKKILEEGLARVKDADGQKALQGTKTQIELRDNPAPAIMAETWLNSSPLTLANLKGKVVIIDFWAPWCTPCRGSIPMLVSQYGRLKEKGLLVIGYTRLYENYRDDKVTKGKVSKDEEIILIGQFVRRFNMAYPVAISHQIKDNPAFQAFGISGIPTLIMIDRAGNVADIQVGYDESFEKNIVERIENLVNSK